MKRDVVRLIHEFLKNIENMGSNTDKKPSVSPLYKEEKILKRASDILPPSNKYKEMQAVKPRRITAYWDIFSEGYRTELFYLQAEFMADFEDDFVYNGEFSRYLPTYEDMTAAQKRGYFSWRAKIRKGIAENTSLSFVLVYSYEIFNYIGISSPEDGFEKLLFIYNNYSARLGFRFKDWIRDFVVYYNMNPQRLKDVPTSENDCSLVLSELHNCIHNGDFSQFAQLLNAVSSYKLSDSKFFALYPDDCNQALERVYTELKTFWGKNRKIPLFEKFFGKGTTAAWRPFNGAVFLEKKRPPEPYVISDFEKYFRKGGHWCHFYYNYHDVDKRLIGEILKTTEHFLRELYEYPRKIKANCSSKIIGEIIEKAVVKYCHDNKKLGIAAKTKQKQNTEKQVSAQPVIVEIDTSKLDGIREKSAIIQEKLIVEPLETPEIFNKSVEVSKESVEPAEHELLDERGIGAFVNKLTDCEKSAVNALLGGGNLSEIAREAGIMTHVLLESINEKALECIDDTLIDANGDTAYIYEEYRRELSVCSTERTEF